MNASVRHTTVVFFDFDHTVIEGESFWAFLSYVAGWPRTIHAFLEGVFLYAKRRHRNPADPEIADHRTFLKAHLLNRLLAGRPVAEFAVPIARLREWMKWTPRVQRALLDHHAKGHRIVIASGGLDLYLPELLKDIPAHEIICTKVEVKDGVVVGAMTSGNCVRTRKAELVAEYLKANGPFAETWGYGNLPHDLPMLRLLKHQVVI